MLGLDGVVVCLVRTSTAFAKLTSGTDRVWSSGDRYWAWKESTAHPVIDAIEVCMVKTVVPFELLLLSVANV